VRLVTSVVIALLSISTAGAARADDPPPRPNASPFRFSFTLDAPIIGLGLAGTSAIFIEPRAPDCLPSCEPPPGLTGLDSGALGYYSPTAHSAADLTVFALLVVPHATHLIATGGKDSAWLEDLVLAGESLVATQGITQVVKASVGRSAPIVYDENVPLDERSSGDAVKSFWSGHTASAFSLATSFAFTYWMRHPRDPWRWVVLAGVESAALCVGLMKIRAGYHWPTDIFAGAAAGTAMGILIPALHTKF
jgi:membrane-associated phospholipid phosphatase